MRTCSKEQTTGRSGYDSEQGEYCGSTTPVLRQKKFESTGLKKNYGIYLITVVYSRIQPNFKLETWGQVPAAPGFFRRPAAFLPPG
jgi:hypothetical protein